MKTYCYSTIVIASLFSVGLTACGGGGGGGDKSIASLSSEPTQTSAVDDITDTETNENIDTETQADILPDTVSPTNLTQYNPDPTLLNSEAKESSELYVDQNFRFEQIKLLTLDISAFSADGSVLSNRLIKIRAVPDGVVSWDDPELTNSELIFLGRTDNVGTLKKSIETTYNLKNVLVEISAIGIENRVLVALDSSDPTLEHTFQ